MKKNIAIVLGGTKNYLFAIGSVVIGIRQHSPNFADDILIFYDQIDDSDKKILENNFGCKLIPFTPPLQRQFTSPSFKRFTPLSLSIYEIFRLLKAYKNVIWLDGDVCIQNDISGIINFGPIGIICGGSSFLSALGQSVDPRIDKQITYNTGVVYVNEKLPNYEKIYDECYYYTSKFINTLRLPDQGVINYVLWKNNISITKLPAEYNYTAAMGMDCYGKATIFHVAHDYKFWNHSIMFNLFPLWKSYYKQWLELGGSAYKGPQFFPEIGDYLSMTQLLELSMGSIKSNDTNSTSSQLIIDEQQKTISKLEANIDELLKFISHIRAPKSS